MHPINKIHIIWIFLLKNKFKWHSFHNLMNAFCHLANFCSMHNQVWDKCVRKEPSSANLVCSAKLIKLSSELVCFTHTRQLLSKLRLPLCLSELTIDLTVVLFCCTIGCGYCSVQVMWIAYLLTNQYVLNIRLILDTLGVEKSLSFLTIYLNLNFLTIYLN